MNILDRIELQVISEYLYMFEYGYSDTLTEKEIALFNNFTKQIDEDNTFDYLVLSYDCEQQEHFARCDIGRLYGMVHDIELLLCKL